MGGHPHTLVEYTGTGKATAVGLAAGPDGLYFTELYKDQNYGSPIDCGARLLRVRYDPGASASTGTEPFSGTDAAAGPVEQATAGERNGYRSVREPAPSLQNRAIRVARCELELRDLQPGEGPAPL